MAAETQRRSSLYGTPARPLRGNARASAQGPDNRRSAERAHRLPHEGSQVVQQADRGVTQGRQSEESDLTRDDAGLAREANAIGAGATPWHNGAPDVRSDLPCPRPRSPVIQRKDVKSTLVAARLKIDELANESQAASTLVGNVSNAVYDYYKPRYQGTLPLSSTQSSAGRDRQFAPTRRQGVLDSATRLDHWAGTANASALRIFEELKGISSVTGVDLATIKMGMDTKTEADATAQHRSGGMVLLESKHVSSPAQGAVDSHVMAASIQLDKRFKQYGANRSFVAHIHVDNEANTWPYTPKQFATSATTGFTDFTAVLRHRLATYKGKSGASPPIRYRITLENRGFRGLHEEQI